MESLPAIDQSWNKLLRIVKGYDIGLFVGAGLSFDNKLPSWESFAARLFGERSPEDARKLAQNGVPFASQLGIAHDAAISTAEIDGDKRKWIERVRESLYREFYKQLEQNGLTVASLREMEDGKRADDKVRQYFQTTNPALSEVVRICAIRGKNGVPRIVTVLTTNLDSLLQVCDRAINSSPRQLRTIERATKSADSSKTSLYHLHGYLQPYPNTKATDEAADRVVLTELEYTQRNDNPNHWAAATLHWGLRECPFVFVGCSMTDELVRRALYRTRNHRLVDAIAEGSERRVKRHSQPKHFVVCQWNEDDKIRDALTSSYGLMDVNPLWIRCYRDLSDRLKSLREKLFEYR